MEKKTTKEILDEQIESLMFEKSKFNKNQVWISQESLIDLIKKREWIVMSCGRSTDYFNEIDIDTSIKSLLKLLEGAK